MKKLNEQNMFQNQANTRGLPFYGGKGDFNFVMGRSQFTPGISIKQLPLSDMSRPSDVGISEFETAVNIIKHFFKPGYRVRGIKINSHLDSENGRTILGTLHKVDINRRNHTIKVYIKDPETLETHEIYIDTMERIYESKYLAFTFSEFLKS